MNKQLQSALNNLSEIDYGQLCMRLDVAKWIRNVMKIYGLTDEDMAALFGFTLKKFKHYKMGAIDYDIEFMANLQAKEMELGIEKLRKNVEKRIQIPGFDNQKNK